MTTSRDIAKLAPLPTQAGGAFVYTPAGWAQVTKANVGLTNVDNTSDSNKPISTAQASAIALKANSANAVFTGNSTTFNTELVRHDPASGISAGYEIGSTAGSATTPYMDWHTGAIPCDYDQRWLFLGGNGSNGNGDCIWFGGTLRLDVRASFSFPVKYPNYTLTTLPAASMWNNALINVTNANGGQKVCQSNGTNWLILNTTTTVF